MLAVMAPSRALAMGLLATAVLATCGVADKTAGGCGLEGTAALPGPPAEMAFACNLEPSGLYHSDILAVRLGERAHMLTHGEGVNRDPRWSPDGARIAFMSTRSGVEQLYVMNADGTGVVQLTHSPGFKGGEDWSPDGTRIAFASSEAGITGPLGIVHAPGDIYVARSDGSGARRLTSGGGLNVDPEWSKDGTRIAFFSDRGGPGEIWVMAVDGSSVRRLTEGPSLNASPSWSPDSARIAFHSERDFPGGYESAIYVMNADGTDQRRLIDGKGLSPAWSSNGRWIAYVSDRDGPWNLYAVRPDGSQLTRLTDDGNTEVEPQWRPA
jgi:Tol biopolymer transport system component